MDDWGHEPLDADGNLPIWELDPARVDPIAHGGARHALLAARVDLGPTALPNGAIHWFKRHPVEGGRPTVITDPDPAYYRREGSTRSQYGGFVHHANPVETPEAAELDRQMWIHADTRPLAFTTARMVAHESYHLHAKAVGLPGTEDDAWAYAQTYHGRYWIPHWFPNGLTGGTRSGSNIDPGDIPPDP